MTFESVRLAYGAKAREYVDAVGRREHIADTDLALVTDWASKLKGKVIDVGSGPGQWTQLLTSLGAEVEGIEPVPEFLAIAKETYPNVKFRQGRAEMLDVPAQSLGGVLAWYSLIHTKPENLHKPLTEFARSLRPGGGLALGFFTGPKLVAFDHAVTIAYCWPLDQLVAHIEDAGFAVAHVESRIMSPTRTHGELLATR
ncbi:class I SAM-dependent methyltransferase [Glutamicibacter sp.]|jgi:Methylase involved in ubiquinone/menaquinone biosynthesis|uniref:class I SAM-dependent methyltransferase n=1 Tax=Glutamicibacter sp. TaxID=1931995 RepID=UPI002B49F158|nr:class I SAM-dependent methyltransferase [Glutamicibacter sp.]HJX78479.1 class I SAM-dependent methyltransferase [Glutamicibacter sp.]